MDYHITGDPLHSRAACTQPCNVNTHSRAHCSPGARLCEQWGHGCVNNGARLCASARLCRGLPVHMRWRHVVTCCRVMCAYYAYVTIRRALGVACFGSRHFVNTVSGQHFSAENKQEAAEFDSQYFPMHFRGVIWKIKSKSNFPVSFSLINAEMNLVGNYNWRQPLRVDGPKASQRSIITHKIHFCTDQAKTHREGRFWFDLSYDVTGVHRQMLRIKFCWFLFVFCRKLSHWDLVYKMAGCAARVT